MPGDDHKCRPEHIAANRAYHQALRASRGGGPSGAREQRQVTAAEVVDEEDIVAALDESQDAPQEDEGETAYVAESNPSFLPPELDF